MNVFVVFDEHCFKGVKERNIKAFKSIEGAAQEIDSIKRNSDIYASIDQFFIDYMDGITLLAHKFDGSDYIDAFVKEIEVR